MPDLTTSYVHLDLKNPLIASASPLSHKLESLQELENAGIAAVVMHSLFEEEIIHESMELDHFLSYGQDISAEAPSHWPELIDYSLKPEVYVEKLARYKKALHIPLIASLNGVSSGGWIKFARQMQDAGADALELNLYYLPVDAALTASELEQTQIALVADVRKNLTIPLAVKLSPFYTALPHFASRLVEAGADALVLFNRFYQPDLDIEELQVVPGLELSTSQELRLPLRWIAILFSRVQADLALTSGVHNAADIVKAVMAGASAVMMASELLQFGAGRIPVLLSELEAWLSGHEYDSIKQMRGSLSQKNIPEPAAYERANYIHALRTFRSLP